MADDRQQPAVSHVPGHPKSLDVEHVTINNDSDRVKDAIEILFQKPPPPMSSPHVHHPEEKKMNDVRRSRSRSTACSTGLRVFQVVQSQAEIFGGEELTEEEKLEQEQAARSIQVSSPPSTLIVTSVFLPFDQARFRGLKIRKNINRDTPSPAGSAEPSSRPGSMHQVRSNIPLAKRPIVIAIFSPF